MRLSHARIQERQETNKLLYFSTNALLVSQFIAAAAAVVLFEHLVPFFLISSLSVGQRLVARVSRTFDSVRGKCGEAGVRIDENDFHENAFFLTGHPWIEHGIDGKRMFYCLHCDHQDIIATFSWTDNYPCLAFL